MTRAGIVDFFLPGGCASCGQWVPLRGQRELVCVGCRSRLVEPSWPRCPRCHHPRGTGREASEECLHCREWPTALAGARYAVVLHPPATTLVHGLKYRGLKGLSAMMGDRMARVISAESSSLFEGRGAAHLVVPVPTTPARLRARGYNQAGALARRVGDRLGVPVGLALMRRGGGVSQTALAPDERRENVRDAFVAMGPVRGQRILLVDDVLTTGATAGAAARALEEAGASRVVLIAFARALPHAAYEAGGRAA